MIIIIVFDVDDDANGDIGDDVVHSEDLLPDFDVALHVDMEAGQLLLQLREVRLVQAGAVHLDHCHHHHSSSSYIIIIIIIITMRRLLVISTLRELNIYVEVCGKPGELLLPFFCN